MSYTPEQLQETRRWYEGFKRNRETTQNYLALISHWDKETIKAALDEIERDAAKQPESKTNGSSTTSDLQTVVEDAKPVAPEPKQPETKAAPVEAHDDVAFRDYQNYVSAIFRPGDTLCFVGIVHNTDKNREKVVNDFVPYEKAVSREYFEHLKRANSEASIYVATNTFPASLIGGTTGRTQENVVEVRALQADVDYNGEATMSAIKSSTLVHAPSIIVESSPGKFQGIWLVDGISKADAKPLMQAIASEFKTDAAVAEIARVMRVPGFVNRKYDSAPVARTMVQTNTRYRREHFKLHVSAASEFKAPKAEDWFKDVVFQHRKIYDQLLEMVGYFIRVKNIKDADVLYSIVKPYCDAAVDIDGVTPFHCNMEQVRGLIEKWVGEFKTGDEYKLSMSQPQASQPAQVPTQPQTQQPVNAQAALDADAKKQAQDEYNALVEKCQEQEERVDNPYPTEAWEGTPYLDFARICRGTGKDENYIPVEYFINAMMTTVGAICGNRVVPAFNPTLQGRFYTLLLSNKGGVGKNTVVDWCKIPFAETGLIYQGELNRKFNNIGCIVADFGSARGMVETMSHHPRILQEYGEFSTVIEKFSIAGSGDAFRDMNLNLADNQIPNWSIIKGTKVPHNAPPEISNSILAGTTDERFQEMMMKSNWETFLQRTNIVPTDETRTKFKLVMPNLEPIKEKLLPRIQMLESHKLVWTLSPEAEAFGEEWFESLHKKVGDEDSESVGRIQVYLFRIISHLALWLAPLPTKVGIETMLNGGAIAIWNYQVPLELMKRATQVAEWQVTARAANMPVRGSTLAGVVENVITKWAFKQKSIRWVELKRRSKIARFGYKACHDALVNLQRSRVLVVKVDPDAPDEQRSWVVVWHGSDGTYAKWKETRGGKRPGAGRKPTEQGRTAD